MNGRLTTFPGNERRWAMKGFINSIRAWFRDEERGIASLTELSPLAVLPHADAHS